MSDEPLSEERVQAFERWYERTKSYFQYDVSPLYVDDPWKHVEFMRIGLNLSDVYHLVAAYRRLRQLVIDAEPHVPDNEATRAINLPARLKAEVERR